MSNLIRTVGARKERIPGVGLTILGEPFEVTNEELYATMVSQEGRFKKTTKAVKKPKPEVKEEQ